MSGEIKKFEVGQRVVVEIDQPETYAWGCAKSLGGAVGVIERFKSGLGYLVHFDKPVEPWSTNQSPCTGFWFSSRDLVPEGP